MVALGDDHGPERRGRSEGRTTGGVRERERRARAPSWWVVLAVLIFAGVVAAAVWSGWSHSDDPSAGPPPISLSDVIRSRGGAPGSAPP